MKRVSVILIYVTCLLVILFAHDVECSEFNICRTVAAHANSGKLKTLEIPFAWPTDKIQERLRKLNTYGEVAQVDINGDGKLEYVVRTSGGTMHASDLAFYDSEWKPIEIGEGRAGNEDNVRGALDMSLIQHDGKVYILGSTDEHLHYLAAISRNNVQDIVCEFDQSPIPMETLAESKNDRLCKAVIDRHQYYARFKYMHALTSGGTKEASFYGTESSHYEREPSENAALIDIDSDGNPELVVQLHISSGAGRGCDATTLGVLNKTRNGLDKERTKLLPEPYCQGSLDYPFVFEGVTYIESKMSAGNPIKYHEISLIKNGKSETVCKFNVVIQHYVIDESNSTKILNPSDNTLWILLRRVTEHPSSDELLRIAGIIDERFKEESVVDMISKSSLIIDNRTTVLDYAAALGRDDLIQFLLERGVDPNLTAKNGRSALAEAVYRGSLRSVQLLLERGANPNARGITKSIIDDALCSYEDKEKKLELLLKHGADPNTQTAITYAIQNGQLWALRLFLKYGAQIDGKLIDDYLDLARKSGSAEMETLLRQVRKKAISYECKSGRFEDLDEACRPRLLRSLDQELNYVYEARMSTLDPVGKSTLRGSQNTWLIQRNYECGIRYRTGAIDGLFAHILADSKRTACMVRVTQERIAEIKNKIDTSLNSFQIPELHIVHAYEAAKPKDAPSGYQNDKGNVTVRIHITGRPVVLVLSSMRSITWVINSDKGAIIKEVILSSEYPSNVVGIDAKIPVTRRHFGFPSNEESPARGSITKSVFAKRLEAYTNLGVKSFQYKDYAGEFDVR